MEIFLLIVVVLVALMIIGKLKGDLDIGKLDVARLKREIWVTQNWINNYYKGGRPLKYQEKFQYKLSRLEQANAQLDKLTSGQTTHSSDAKSDKSLNPLDELKNIPLTDKARNELLNTIKRVEAGEAYASGIVSSYYASGKILTPEGEAPFPKDKAKALWWKIKSAEDGCAAEQHSLGQAYDWGDGYTDNLVERDDNEALKWYLRAAENGEFFSLGILGEKYFKGEGVSQDYQKAFEWFSRSVDHPTAKQWGFYDAGLRIGEMYATGKGLGQDFVQAYKWINIAGRDPEQYYECPLNGKLSTEEKEKAKLMAKEWRDRK